MPITRGFSIGYRMGAKGGVWLAKLAIADFRQEKTIGPADRRARPEWRDGVELTRRLRKKRRDWKTSGSKANRPAGRRSPITVREALYSYEADLKACGGDIENVGRMRAHLSDNTCSTKRLPT